MLSYNELKPGVVFIKDGGIYVVLTFSFSKKQRQAPTAAVKARNLVSGKVLDFTAQQSDSFEEAEIEKMRVKFVYGNRGEYWFEAVGGDDVFRCVVNGMRRSRRFSLGEEVIGNRDEFLKEGLEVRVLVFGDKIVGVELPIKADYEVVEAPPSIRGNTSQGGTKMVTIESGAKITTPLFVEQGDVIRVNTEKGEYVERVKKGHRV